MLATGGLRLTPLLVIPAVAGAALCLPAPHTLNGPRRRF